VSPQADDSQICVILLDIEGTTTPVDFVYKTLFPYASRRVEPFLREHFGEREIQSLAAELCWQHQRDENDGLHPPNWNDETDELRLHSCVAYVGWLIGRDSKCTPLKMLQGKIWQQGYERGELQGEVYADVARAFARWRRQGREICIYSSGSVLAQQLLFRSTAAGDLTEYISGFFDTHIGAKTESDSYRRIAESLARSAAEVLFISDAIKEVEAARLASMRAVLCQRLASTEDSATNSRIIHSFDQILPEV
jgi:enolase-phosphatase E1